MNPIITMRGEHRIFCYYYYSVTVSEQEADEFANSMETLVIEYYLMEVSL